MDCSQTTESFTQEASYAKENTSVATADSPSKPKKSEIPVHSGIVHQIFQSQPQSKLFSHKITKRAVNWLMIVAWQKNCSLQSTWTALLLFYGYRRRKNILKNQLQCLLLVCLQLSTKFHETAPLKTSQLLFSCSEAVSRDLFMKLEEQILELFCFQIYVPHTLECLAICQNLTQQQNWKVLFLAELYLIKDDSIFFDWQKCQKLIELVKGEQEKCQLECLQIRELINDGKDSIVFKKYGCKFDVQTFTQLFQ